VIDIGTDFFTPVEQRGGNGVVVMHSILSTEGANRLRRGRLVYEGGDSSTEGGTLFMEGVTLFKGAQA